MTIDWNHFTPVLTLAGKAMIGLVAAALLLLNGRIAGVSGILGGLLRSVNNDIAWCVAFLAGLLLAPIGYALVGPCRSRSSIPEPQRC